MKQEDVKIGMEVKIVDPECEKYCGCKVGDIFTVEKQCHGDIFKLSDGIDYHSYRFEPYIPEKTTILDPTWSKEQLIAYDSFLLSELHRHLEDVEAICEKRAMLHIKGFKSEVEGPWIHKKDIARM